MFLEFSGLLSVPDVAFVITSPPYFKTATIRTMLRSTISPTQLSSRKRASQLCSLVGFMSTTVPSGIVQARAPFIRSKAPYLFTFLSPFRCVRLGRTASQLEHRLFFLKEGFSYCYFFGQPQISVEQLPELSVWRSVQRQ